MVPPENDKFCAVDFLIFTAHICMIGSMCGMYETTGCIIYEEIEH